MMSRFSRQLVGASSIVCAILAASGNPARAQLFTLSVNPFSGVVTIRNSSASSTLSLDGYQITSPSGKLVPNPSHTPGAGWKSLADQGLSGWQEVSPTVTALSELNLTGATSLSALGSLNLGNAFVAGGTQDLSWGYSAPAGGGSEVAVNPGPIVYAGGLQVQVISLLTNNSNSIESTKTVLLNQETSQSFGFDAYTVRSAAGSLNPAGFSGFAAHSVAGWESVSPSTTAISELNLTSSTTLSPTRYQALGSPFTTGATKDLSLQFHLVGASVTPVNGTILYKNQLAGDANNDGIVDVSDIQQVAANYLQNSLLADTNYDGIVDVSDIQMIAAHYLNTLGAGSGAGVAVPEPATAGPAALALAVVAGSGLWRRFSRLSRS
ncbi:MAG: hypothetical protein HYX69_05035 [Planctomycetia bacterium]|nr:hypothetical protein [Planctomycetia bacterium]